VTGCKSCAYSYPCLSVALLSLARTGSRIIYRMYLGSTRLHFRTFIIGSKADKDSSNSACWESGGG